MWAGIPQNIIDDLSPIEITTAAEIEQEKQKDFYKMLAWICYNTAALTGVAMNDPKRFPTLEDSFPILFEKKEQQDWWIIKERVEQYSKAKKGLIAK